ncbi:MAG: csgD [Nocardia sp.]|uniref:helix-turn-helix domain-containing protein n=1 Tax=Nocardia sp. TaxID=1821 RepID=UPI0026282714|nr:helix-turn-helix transcriptional regulator [Nocardia sp.]MCU1643030.1 csgD [Nocardia sp.]
MSPDAARKALDLLVTLDLDLRHELRLEGRQRMATTLPEAIAISEESTAVALSAEPSGFAAADAARARLITGCLTAQSEARELVHRTRSHRVSAIARSITRMRAASSADALIRQTCSELTGALDFRCATYSVIDTDGYWIRYVYPRGNAWLPQDSTKWQLSPEELRCVVEGRPIIVGDAMSKPAGAMSMLLGATNYVVAPVILNSEVSALFHAARALPWTVDSADVKLLDLIASAFAVVSEREMRSDRLQRRQQAIFAAARRLVADTESFVGGDIDLDIGGQTSPRPVHRAPMRPALRELLTQRETEVLKLIVAGASNNEIADQLVITVETVKSHVKKVLRKLGAVNRAEAISLYLDDKGPTPR